MTRMSTQWQRHMDSLKRPAAPTLPPRTTQPTGWGQEADRMVNLHGQ
jgi:hypothetical protein